MSISVILPAYKEAENLLLLLPKIKFVLENMDIDFEILVVDTMLPTDNTKEICDNLNCRYIPRRNGNFYGDAIRTGIIEAKKQFFVVMDADGSHNPEDIPKFYNEMSSGLVDLVIGSRYINGGNTHNGFILRFMSYMVNFAYRVIFRLNIKDISNSYRMYKTEQIKNLKLICDNFDLVEEILIRLKIKHKNFKVKEIPIYFNKRNFGESKRNLLLFIFSYIITILRLLKIKREK